ncbi:nucleoside triphosphate pyrophosphohydrolase [Cytobacillus gottheilii]|uniref:Nucleoside triphosphate pyrophosphohydrolase n=1 Tax=Cytobacillus gottheilii TaxID=859144 RepID=A0ABX8FF73_9BACI|nr:nucleoside triphosphate pyrophosphohydrolase [Cytobacillus gottheilii]QVY62671.1 nucleoside triphosphate pyrophosphohydrolase [Cytobacillus gottheilii]
MPLYNKLVRDKIPAIINNTAKDFHTKRLSEDEYIIELKKKLNEEISEYQIAGDNQDALEELADVLEIIHSLAIVHGADIDEIEKIRQKKAEEKGSFQERIFLIDVED